MPVSWHNTVLFSSATLMFLIMVPSTDLPVASVSVLSRRAKPSLMSGGKSFTARMYNSLHASSISFKSTFIAAPLKDDRRKTIDGKYYGARHIRLSSFARRLSPLALHTPFAHGLQFDVTKNKIFDHEPDDDHRE